MRPTSNGCTSIWCLLTLVAALSLSACGRGDADSTDDQRNAAGSPGAQLPAPEGARGSITGMPNARDPGALDPNQTRPPVDGLISSSDVPPDTAVDSEGNILLPPSDRFDDGSGSVPGYPGQGGLPPAMSEEPSSSDAVAVMREYYSAINAGSFGRAYALWADGGRASGQSPQQFASGFANAVGVSVELMQPGRVDAAAGSRYIEVPVAITSTYRDGSQRKYGGVYTLRRAAAGGASADQRAWRIASADIREVQP